MALVPEFQYVFLDFETTGLDVQQDYPIQIGIIQTDHHFRIVDHYRGYLSLPDSVFSLKSNISYLTGIDVATIQSQGQSYEDIANQIARFFGDQTVIIGQNIAFDLAFLRRFFPTCRYADAVDTYPLFASMIPHLTSYSLEAIDQHLSTVDSYMTKKQYLLHYCATGEELSSHDALYDCVVGVSALEWWIGQWQEFVRHYPWLAMIRSRCPQEQQTWRSYVAMAEAIDHQVVPQLPVLSSPVKQTVRFPGTTPSYDRSQASQHSKRLLHDKSIRDTITQFPERCIIACSHSSKIDIIKRACLDVEFSYLKPEQTIDHTKLQSWLQRPVFTYDELQFIVLYLAHHRAGYRIIQPILTPHKHILDYLQVITSPLPSHKRILCTHGGLYHMMLQTDWQQSFGDYPIFLIDADRWHTTYNDFAQKGINLTNTMFQRESWQYKMEQMAGADQLAMVQSLLTYWQLFIAYFAMDAEKYLSTSPKREIDYILDHPSFEKSNGLRKTLQNERNVYTGTYGDYPVLARLLQRIDSLFHNTMVISRVVSSTKDISYVIAPSVRYIDFAEYLKMFGDQTLLFFSHTRSEYHSRGAPSIEQATPVITEISSPNEILSQIDRLASDQQLFVLSHSSEKSRKIFQMLCEHPIIKTHRLVAEHLTGSVAKISSLHSDKPMVCIGGYHLLLQLWVQGQRIDKVVIAAIYPTMKPFISNDILYYAIPTA